MKQYRTGIVGVGFIGMVHIEALRRMGNVTVVAICNNINCKEIAKRLNVPQAYDDYKAMIDSTNIDFIHICTPNNTHFEIASYALAHGVNVICEKPLALSSLEAVRLEELAAANGRINAVNFHCRCYPMVRQMKEMIAQGELGNIFSVHGEYLQDWLLYQTDYSWRLEHAEGGSSRAVADIGSHWLDTTEYVTGRKIHKVFADFATFYPERCRPKQVVETFSNAAYADYERFSVKTEDYAQILLEFDNGMKGSAVISQMFAGYKNKMTLSVAGAQKSMAFDSEKLNELWIGQRDGFNMIAVKDPSLLSAGARELDSYPGGHIEGFADAFKHNFRQIYESVKTGGENREYAAFSDGAREMKLCESILRSAREGRWVDVE